MQKILFVCHGNICRSPMAEFVFIDLAGKAGLGYKYAAASAATSREELGNPVYPPVRRLLGNLGISTAGKTARQMTKADYAEYDYLIGMDDWNMRNIMRIIGSDPEHKVYQLLDFTDEPGEIPDPWYTGEFNSAYEAVLRGCRGLLNYLESGAGQGTCQPRPPELN